jgi:hypothetical protein
VVCIALLWIGAQFASIGQEVSNVVTVFSTAALVSTVVTICGTVGVKPLVQKIHKNSDAVEKVKKMTSSIASKDWVRALVVFAGLPALPVIMILSFVNQRMRVVFHRSKLIPERWKPTKKLEKNEWQLPITKYFWDQLRFLKNWRWCAIFLWMIYIGLIFLTIQVGVAKITAVFLSWLNGELAPMPMYAVLFIYVLVGLFMFLNPAIPGMPVYITGGILVTQKGKCDNGGDDAAFAAGLGLACLSCWAIKILSVIIQHKVIGEKLGTRLWVKSLIGINSPTTKAMGIILSRPGLDLAKTYILVAGPDWPTTVLTGVLGCPIWSVLGGSMFIISLIAPACMSAAALIYEKPCDGVVSSGSSGSSSSNSSSVSGSGSGEEEGSSKLLTISALCIAFTGIVQVYMLVQSAKYINHTIKHEKEAIAAKGIDQEVEDYDEALKRRRQLWKCVTQWELAPKCIKTTIASGAIFMAMSVYMIIGLGESCFKV